MGLPPNGRRCIAPPHWPNQLIPPGVVYLVAQKVERRYAVAITPAMQALIAPDDPIGRQFIPDSQNSSRRRTSAPIQSPTMRCRRSRAWCTVIPIGRCSSRC